MSGPKRIGPGGLLTKIEQEVYEVEHHFHSRERWFGQAAIPVGTSHVADRIGPGILPFQIMSGNNAWGAWVQVLGSLDTPVFIESMYFDPHHAVIVDADAVGAYFFQLASGPDPDQAIALGNYTEFVYATASNQIDVGTLFINARRTPVGTMGWARTLVPVQNAKSAWTYFGFHEYER